MKKVIKITDTVLEIEPLFCIITVVMAFWLTPSSVLVKYISRENLVLTDYIWMKKGECYSSKGKVEIIKREFCTCESSRNWLILIFQPGA